MSKLATTHLPNGRAIKYNKAEPQSQLAQSFEKIIEFKSFLKSIRRRAKDEVREEAINYRFNALTSSAMRGRK